ncbi:MAG: hypothetical protein R3C11_11580 [Planctomycetaceae bacterium]
MITTHYHKLTCFLIALCFLSGCSESEFSRERVSVSGTLKIGDEYVEEARVEFIPLEPADGPTASAIVTNGLFTISEETGPLTGKLRVEIFPVGIELEDLTASIMDEKLISPFKTSIPQKYQKHSQEFTVDAFVDRPNEYDFVLEED